MKSENASFFLHLFLSLSFHFYLSPESEYFFLLSLHSSNPSFIPHHRGRSKDGKRERERKGERKERKPKPLLILQSLFTV